MKKFDNMGWQAMSATQIMTGVNERRLQAHMQKVPLPKNLIGLLFVSHELSFDCRMSLTSIMAHRGIDLVGLDAGTPRDIFIEMFCNPRTAVDDLSSIMPASSSLMKVNLMAPVDFGPKMRTMVQEAFWMRAKTYFTLTMNRMNHGFGVIFFRPQIEKRQRERARWKRPRQRPWWKKILQISAKEERLLPGRSQSVEDWSLQTELKPGGGKVVGQTSQIQQMHGNHGIRN